MPKSAKGCAVFFILIIILVALTSALSGRNKERLEESRKQHQNELQNTIADKFSDLKTDKRIANFTIKGRKITVVYKEELPDYVEIEIRNLAARGSSHFENDTFTAECAVSQAPQTILHSETRANRRPISIKFEKNKFAKDAKKEQARLKEADRQKRHFAQQLKLSLAYDSFVNKHCISRTGECIPVTRIIKETAHNPESITHVKTKVYLQNEDGLFPVTATYRGTNPMGGIVTNTVKCLVSPDGKKVFLDK